MILGIDIGGTTAKCSVVNEAWEPLCHESVPTAERDSDAIVDALVTAVAPLCRRYGVTAVGVGCAGRIHPPTGTVLRASHLPFQNEPLAQRLSDALSLPVTLGNDANCAMLAEATVGACADCKDALMLTLGTGIGGAILIDGKPVEGFNFRAGELGHFVIDRHGPACPCGLRGCFEQYASASALTALAATAAKAHPDSLLAQSDHSGKAVFAAAAQGCPVADEVLAAYAEQLALGINSLVKIFMPECIVLAGGLAGAGDALLDRLSPHLLPEASLRLSALGGNAGVIGAALLTRSYSSPKD